MCIGAERFTCLNAGLSSLHLSEGSCAVIEEAQSRQLVLLQRGPECNFCNSDGRDALAGKVGGLPRAYPKRGLTLSGEAKKPMKSTRFQKGQTPFRMGS